MLVIWKYYPLQQSGKGALFLHNRLKSGYVQLKPVCGTPVIR